METQENKFKKMATLVEYSRDICDVSNLSEEQLKKIENEIYDFFDNIHIVRSRFTGDKDIKYFDEHQEVLGLGRIERTENFYKISVNKKVNLKGLEILSEIINIAKGIKSQDYN